VIEKVITGGQTGADQAGWRAARKAGIPCGGCMPKGFLTEDGPRPEFAELYGAREMPTADYPARTNANVHMADATILFGSPRTPGSRLLLRLEAIRRSLWPDRPPVFEVPSPWVPGDFNSPQPNDAAWWIDRHRIKVLNVAGNRESSAPGIGAWAEAFLAEMFDLCGHPPVPMRLRHLREPEDVVPGPS
jgi:hypothetical protein